MKYLLSAIKWSFLLMALLSVVTISVVTTKGVINSLNNYTAQYDAEMDCVADMVKHVERKDIATGNGTCWYEPNGYYLTKR